MNKDIILKIRENNELYTFLKYNSYLYKSIFRGDISIKVLDKMKKEFFNQTPEQKLHKFADKIETINTILEIFK
ncbi:MAG: hypothetical protein IJN90_06105 [Bacilli bacterium]|nr:hypothetical protein [Bacilli bacterium]